MNDSEPKADPQPLGYPSPPLSPYDRPIEPFVTFARQFRRVVRVGCLLFALLVMGLILWGALRMSSVFYGYAQ